MDFAKYDEKLRRRQVAYQEGIHLLRMTRAELIKDISTADNWALAAVMSNAVLVPVNIIVNTFLPFTPVSKFQKIVQFVYDQTAASGTRAQSESSKDVMDELGKLGKETTDYLTKNALGEYAPGVRILVGLAQDSIALMEVAKQTSDGQSEMRKQLHAIDRKIGAFFTIMGQLGIERALLHDKVSTIRRTA